MKHTTIALAAALGLTGCASTGSAPDPATAAPEPPAAAVCNAGPVQSYVGQKATQASGAAILAGSGARTLRWGPPGGAWTMDYRQDRVNVRYDDAMTITGITCG